jgi:hypothetical protein
MIGADIEACCARCGAGLEDRLSYDEVEDRMDTR